MKAYNLLLFITLLASQLLVAYARSDPCPDCAGYANGAYLPDTKSCSRYYVCLNGRAVRRTCGRGLYFDSTTFICNIPALVKCQTDGGRVEIPVEESTCSTTTCTPPPQECSTTTCSTSTVCSTTTCTPPPPEDCTTTTTCSTTPTTCSTTTCTPPPEDCSTTTCTPPPPEDCSTTTCTTTPVCSTTTCTPPPAECSNEQPTDEKPEIMRNLSDCSTLKDGTFLLDANHCRRFYVCYNGKARRLKCTLGQWFDFKAKSCRDRAFVTNCPAQRN